LCSGFCVCGDPITHSFGEGYATRADEEGFGTVYARGDDEERPSAIQVRARC
jgi:hypothetical protein